jgi:peptide/nickel transport system substrate-binding protein
MARHRLATGLLAVLCTVALGCQAAGPPRTGNNAPGGAPAPSSAAAAPAAPASSGPTRVVVGQANPLDSQDPLNHTESFLYAFWCEVAGCLLGWDAKTGEPQPALAERWTVENGTDWTFHLRHDVKWQDGSPFTAEDVVYSLQAVAEHPAGKQKYRLATVASFEAVDSYTVRVVTKKPNSQLLDELFVLGVPMLSKAQHERGDDLGKALALATGPYQLKEWVPAQRMVIAKNPAYWGGKVDGPDEVVYRVIKEDQARVTALLSGEVQIASNVPVQDADRVKSTSGNRVLQSERLSNQFLAMAPKFEPWGNLKLRQAVNYAIDKDAIIQGVLKGYAQRLDAPVGPGQVAYTPDIAPKYTYDPAKAKQLVIEAGYPNGVDVELYSPVNFLVKDTEITQAIVPMLNAVGIRAKLMTPEWSTLWTNIQAGKVPFFYLGRGQWRDPGAPLVQYFETTRDSRLGFSDPQIDALLEQQRATFEPEARKRVLVELMNRVQEEAPVVWLWRYQLLWGVAPNVEWTPRSDEGVLGSEIRVH